VVPNLSWGWGLNYEADLIAVSAARLAVEIEIKVSRSDLRADAQKDKWKPRMGGPVALDSRISRFFYAVPMALVPDVEKLEGGFPGAGIIGVEADHQSKIVRKAEVIKTARKVSDEEMMKLGHLVAMRYWDERETRARLLDEIKSMKAAPPPRGAQREG
jgi:hypothetical protein